ncbi:MAG: hypothetical protein D6701_08155 [Gemmatimonadetes bacterium]|nr:MAG: hypothetical protein D6701_08155 [Gemmatimonadota bacterium]
MRGAALMLLVLAACEGSFDGVFPEPRTYRFEFFATREECQAAQPPGFHINCSQTIEFRPDGRAFVTLTDIINPATYGIRGRRVRVEPDGPGDFAGTLELELSEDEALLTDVDTGKVWVRDGPEGG